MTTSASPTRKLPCWRASIGSPAVSPSRWWSERTHGPGGTEVNVRRSAADITELAVLLIPLRGRQLVLPNVNVAEVIPWQAPRDDLGDIDIGQHQLSPNVNVAEVIPWQAPRAGTEVGPDWLLGSLEWRQQQIPLICLEEMNGESAAAADPLRRIAVLNDVLGAEELPFFAVVTAGAPRLLRLFPDEIGLDIEREPGPMERSRVWVAGERGSLFDLARVEEELRQVLARR